MPELDIDTLRVTSEDFAYNWRQPPFVYRSVADIQLAKALWGVVDWLEEADPWDRVDILEDHLLAAGIPKPEDTKRG